MSLLRITEFKDLGTGKKTYQVGLGEEINNFNSVREMSDYLFGLINYHYEKIEDLKTNLNKCEKRIIESFVRGHNLNMEVIGVR